MKTRTKVLLGVGAVAVVGTGAFLLWPKTAAASGSSGGIPLNKGGVKPPPPGSSGTVVKGGASIRGGVTASGGAISNQLGPGTLRLRVVQPPPGYQAQSVSLAWPQDSTALLTTINVSDILTIVINDPTSSPACAPSQPGAVHNCNGWVVSLIQGGNAVNFGDASSMLAQMAGDEDATSQLRDFGVIHFVATAPGTGALIFTQQDASGNTLQTWSIPLVIGVAGIGPGGSGSQTI